MVGLSQLSTAVLPKLVTLAADHDMILIMAPASYGEQSAQRGVLSCRSHDKLSFPLTSAQFSLEGDDVS